MSSIFDDVRFTSRSLDPGPKENPRDHGRVYQTEVTVHKNLSRLDVDDKTDVTFVTSDKGIALTITALSSLDKHHFAECLLEEYEKHGGKEHYPAIFLLTSERESRKETKKESLLVAAMPSGEDAFDFVLSYAR